MRRGSTKSKLHRNVWATSGTSFLTDVSSEMLLNVLPLFLANVLGVRIWAIGLVEGFAEATSSILKLYSGWLSDRLGDPQVAGCRRVRDLCRVQAVLLPGVELGSGGRDPVGRPGGEGGAYGAPATRCLPIRRPPVAGVSPSGCTGPPIRRGP